MERKLITAYVAADGKEFMVEADCIAYEKNLEEQRKREEDDRERERFEREKLLSMDTGKVFMPLSEHQLDEEVWYFRWFRLNNKDDYDFICDLVTYGIVEPEQYPAYVCLEGEGDPIEYLGSEYSLTLEQCISETEWFFKQFGLKVEFHKEEENRV